jgi:hypothetical protein
VFTELVTVEFELGPNTGIVPAEVVPDVVTVLWAIALASNKYPPAEPVALRLLAHQRGLTATGEKQKQPQQQQRCYTIGFCKTNATAGGILPEFSKFYCHPGSRGISLLD